MHEIAHKRFCDWFGIPVQKVVYFRFGDPAGYVIHAEPVRYSAVFWIAVGPLIINSIVAVAFAYFASQEIMWGVKWFIFLWMALTLGMCAFPSNHDVQNIAEKSKEMAKRGNPFYLFAYPFVWIIFLANGLRRWGFDLLYAGVLIYFGFYII